MTAPVASTCGLVAASGIAARAVVCFVVMSLIAVDDEVKGAEGGGALSKVKITLVGKQLSADEVLRRVSATTGVRVTASDHLRDRWLTIGAREVLAAEVIDDLRKLFDSPRYPCSIQNTKAGGTMIWQDRRAAFEFERMLDAERRMILASYLRVTANGVPNQPRSDWSKDPVLKSLANPGNWKRSGQVVLQRLSEMGPSERSSLAAGNTVWVDASHVSPRLKSPLAQVFQQGGTVPDKYGMSISVSESSESWRVYLSASTKSQKGTVSHIRKHSTGLLVGDVGFSIPRTEVNAIDLPGKSASKLPVNGKWNEFADFQLDLSRASGVTLVSDYYHQKNSPLPEHVRQIKDNWPLLIDRVTQPIKYDAWKHREGLVFRSHQWFYDDLSEVPARMYARLVQSTAKRGSLAFDEVAEIGVLNDRQQRILGEVIPVADRLSDLRPLFRWYRKLPIATRRQVVNGKGCLVGQTNHQDLLNEEGELIPLVAPFAPVEALRIQVATASINGRSRFQLMLGNGRQSVSIPIEQEIKIGG